MVALISLEAQRHEGHEEDAVAQPMMAFVTFSRLVLPVLSGAIGKSVGGLALFTGVTKRVVIYSGVEGNVPFGQAVVGQGVVVKVLRAGGANSSPKRCESWESGEQFAVGRSKPLGHWHLIAVGGW